MRENEGTLSLADIRFVKDVVVGSVNPAVPFSDSEREAQVALLNRCLSEHPRGVIIGSDIQVGRYLAGQHELTVQRTVYHVGFARRPVWLGDDCGVAR